MQDPLGEKKPYPYNKWDQDYAIDTGRLVVCPRCDSSDVDESMETKEGAIYEWFECMDCGAVSDAERVY